MHATGSVEGPWKAVMNWYQPIGDAERDHLEKYFKNIAMQAEEDPKLFFARVDGKLNVLALLGILKSDSEVVRLVNRRFSSEVYDLELRTVCFSPALHAQKRENRPCLLR